MFAWILSCFREVTNEEDLNAWDVPVRARIPVDEKACKGASEMLQFSKDGLRQSQMFLFKLGEKLDNLITFIGSVLAVLLGLALTFGKELNFISKPLNDSGFCGLGAHYSAVFSLLLLIVALAISLYAKLVTSLASDPCSIHVIQQSVEKDKLRFGNRLKVGIAISFAVATQTIKMKMNSLSNWINAAILALFFSVILCGISVALLSFARIPTPPSTTPESSGDSACVKLR